MQMSSGTMAAIANCGPIWIPKAEKGRREENNGEINHCSLKIYRLDSTNSAGTKLHQNGAPESAGEILHGEAGF